MDERQAHAVHVVDQSIAEITAKIDDYRDRLAADIDRLGYEVATARFNAALVPHARRYPDAIAALASVAIARLARGGDADVA